MAQDLRQQLAEIAQRRVNAEAEAKALNDQEQELIAQAWREHVPPAEIAELVGRSAAHVRKLRPDDVPPLRLGGGAAPKKGRRGKR
ncbi:hypothetical protein ACIA5D_36700 [Actinoplanes sp. NPDC051513]|uniref:hypothetical protein n=1 Tax=Actinoplanes sp. NPDC051513 TaxID=3363908 RepID=UPI003798E775